MAELKTKINDGDVTAFLNTVTDVQKRTDSFEVLQLMETITGEPAKMWGTAIIGFGSYHYKYASGREGDWMEVGFSPRKNALTLYIMSGFGKAKDLLSKLGKFKTGKSCLYIKKLEDIDRKVLAELVTQSVNHLRSKGMGPFV